MFDIDLDRARERHQQQFSRLRSLDSSSWWVSLSATIISTGACGMSLYFDDPIAVACNGFAIALNIMFFKKACIHRNRNTENHNNDMRKLEYRETVISGDIHAILKLVIHKHITLDQIPWGPREQVEKLFNEIKEELEC